MSQKELLAPCGLYCGVCGIYQAHREDNWKFKLGLAKYFQCEPEDIACRGCLSDLRFIDCRNCAIRECTFLRGFEGCHQCDDFPCELVSALRPLGRMVVLRAIPAWRELGTEEFVKQEIKRYHCPECGYPSFRGARRCRICGAQVNLD